MTWHVACIFKLLYSFSYVLLVYFQHNFFSLLFRFSASHYCWQERYNERAMSWVENSKQHHVNNKLINSIIFQFIFSFSLKVLLSCMHFTCFMLVFRVKSFSIYICLHVFWKVGWHTSTSTNSSSHHFFHSFHSFLLNSNALHLFEQSLASFKSFFFKAFSL